MKGKYMEEVGGRRGWGGEVTGVKAVQKTARTVDL